MGSTNYLNTKQMNALLQGVAFVPPGSLYIALYTTAPTISGTGGIEVAGGGYARIPIASTSSEWSGPNSSLAYTNVNDVVFAAPTANWGTVSAIVICTHATSGSVLFVSNLTTARTITNGEGAPRFAAGGITLQPA